MNWKTFFAMLARDAHVARRNLLPTLLQVLLQPMLFVFVFGRVLTRAGFMPDAYKALLLPGVMAISMVMSGMWGVAMPLMGEFQFTREIEDRLLAPMDSEWLAVEKIVAGMIQALISGLVVLPAAWLLLGSGSHVSFHNPVLLLVILLLIAVFSAAGGLTLGSTVGMTHTSMVFSLVLAPMIFFGCTYYPWSALASFPIIQRAVLINPLVYASEGLRAALAPQFAHLSLLLVLIVLTAFDAALLWFGLNRFNKKALN